jgi:glycosyltransferase involved in cell wall biosynthesis
MAQRVRILLLIPHLGGGGAEQVTALLARGLSRDKYELHLGLVTRSTVAVPALPPWITVHNLNASRVRGGAFRLLQLVRGLKPDVILSGMAHLNFLVLLLKPFFPSATRVLVRQNGTVSSTLAHGGLPRYTRLLYRLLYRHADRVICQSRAMAVDMAGELEIGADLIAVLPNPVDLDGIRAARNDPDRWIGPGPHLLAMGRLAREKGFDLLLRAFARVHSSFPQADLLIAGSGPEETALKALCHQLGLDEWVRFAGHIARPYGLFPGTTLFVLSSRHEGMPNALLEAIAAGLPVVAVPSSGGVVDLLRGRSGAWVATEISAASLADSLVTALLCLHAEPHLDCAFSMPCELTGCAASGHD